MSAAVSIYYIYDYTASGQSRLYKQRKSSVHGTVSYYVVFQNIPGYDVLLSCTLWTGFYPPGLCLSTCKEFIVRVQYHMLCFKTYR